MIQEVTYRWRWIPHSGLKIEGKWLQIPRCYNKSHYINHLIKKWMYIYIAKCLSRCCTIRTNTHTDIHISRIQVY